MNIDPLLTISNLHIEYGNVHAVQGVDLLVPRNEIVTILGVNGAGKTSVLNAIAGVTRPRGGSVYLEGTDLLPLSVSQRARLGIALVPTGRRLFSRLTVKENLSIAGTSAQGKGRSNLSTEIERVSTIYPRIASLMNREAGLLSGGEQQQVAIARALLTHPRLLILDEPSLGLAPSMTDTLFDTIVQLQDEGTTILIVEQNASRALAVANRAYVLTRGTVTFSGSSLAAGDRKDIAGQLLGG